MRGRQQLGRLSGALALSAALAAGAAAPVFAATQTPIQHVVVLYQENISFDHYFGTYPNVLHPNESVGGEQYGQSFTALAGTPTVDGLTTELLNNNQNQNYALTAYVSPARLAPDQAYTCGNSHAYLNEQEAVDKGLMDRFPTYTAGRGGEGCLTDGSTVMAYFDGNTVTALWNYAQHYAMSDNSFGSTFGPSTPGAVNLVSGQTLGGILHHVGSSGNVLANTDSATSGTGIDETVTDVTDTGDNDAYLDDCGGDKGGTTISGTLEMTSKNIGDLLSAQGLTFGWFQGGFAPTTPAAVNSDGSTSSPAVCGQSHIEHLYPNTGTPIYSLTNQIGSSIGGNIQSTGADYVSHHAGLMFYASTRNPHHLAPTPGATLGGPDAPNYASCAPSSCTGANHNYDSSVLLNALANGQTLPAVTFVKAPSYQNAHPGNSDPLLEQTWLTTVINAIVASPNWPTTAIIIAYDDSDGWYDHVMGPVVNQSSSSQDALSAPGNCGTPPAADQASWEGRCGHAFRQPLLVISPWAKQNYVDHTLTNQASIIAFIEYNWKLGTIGTIDGSTSPQTPGTASFDQSAGSLLGMFNFTGAPNVKHLLLNPTGTVISDN